MSPKRRKKHWSYNAGERGRNWVRAFKHARDGKFYLEWREVETDGRVRRRANLLPGITDPAEAKAKADELAAKFAELVVREDPQVVTLRSLLLRYQKEVTPTKGKGARSHDRRAGRLWVAFFDGQPEEDRRSGRDPVSLDRIDWDRFIEWRRQGRIPGSSGPVRNRAIQYDLKFLVAVLNWGSGTPLLHRNPWSADVRRSQRWEMPRERSPHRPSMTVGVREALIAHAPSWQFSLALILQRETRRRNNAIRQLQWSDIDQEAWVVTWRKDADKARRQARTPLTQPAVAALRSAPSRGIGDTPVFPSAEDPTKATSRDTFQTWLRRAKAGLTRATPDGDRPALKCALRGVGFHSEKRAGVRDPEFRRLPPKVQEALAGTSWDMLRETYDEVSVADMRDALGLPAEGPEPPPRGPNYDHQLRAEG